MIPMQQFTTFDDATPLLDQPDALRQRAWEEGYLFLPGLLDPQSVLAVRSGILEQAAEHGYLRHGTPSIEGIASSDATECEWNPLYKAILAMRDFHALAVSPSILRFFDLLFDAPTLAHPRNICRLTLPNSHRTSTPPHQDHFYIHGTENCWTAWIPLGDCPEELGGLALIPRSHRGGPRGAFKAAGAGGHAVEVQPDEAWVGGPMKAGDVLVFHSLTVHQARDNQTDRVRLSGDFRYQPAHEKIARASLAPHLNLLDWEEIYRDWPENDPLRYYWKQAGLPPASVAPITGA